MNPNVFNIFPHPVARYNFDFGKSLIFKKYITDYIKENSSYGNDGSDQLSHYREDFSQEKYNFFLEWIDECATHYVTEVMGRELHGEKMISTNIWLNKCDYGGEQYAHNHTNAYVCGTYYVNFKSDHAPITFYNRINSGKYTAASIELDINTDNIYNSDAKIQTEESYLYLWPAYLMHGYTENNANSRISVSMNFLPRVIDNGLYRFSVQREELNPIGNR